MAFIKRVYDILVLVVLAVLLVCGLVQQLVQVSLVGDLNGMKSERE